MSTIVDRLPIPKHLPARLWLLTLPSAVLSFERRSNLPKLPLGALRFAGIPLIGAGAALAIWGSRRPDVALKYPDAVSRGLPDRPATAGALLAILGVGVFLRSPALCLYALGLAVASGSEIISIQDPSSNVFVGGKDRDDEDDFEGDF